MGNFHTQERKPVARSPSFILAVHYLLRYPGCGTMSPNWNFPVHSSNRMHVNSHILPHRETQGRQGSFCIWKSHSQIKHNCLKKNDPEVNATSVASLDGCREGFKAQATANFDSGLLTKAFRSVIFCSDSPKPAQPAFFTDPVSH